MDGRENELIRDPAIKITPFKSRYWVTFKFVRLVQRMTKSAIRYAAHRNQRASCTSVAAGPIRTAPGAKQRIESDTVRAIQERHKA